MEEKVKEITTIIDDQLQKLSYNEKNTFLIHLKSEIFNRMVELNPIDTE